MDDARTFRQMSARLARALTSDKASTRIERNARYEEEVGIRKPGEASEAEAEDEKAA